MIFDVGHVLVLWEPELAFEQVMPADHVPAFMERIGFDDWNRVNDALASIAGSEDDLAQRFPEDADGIRGYRTHFLRTVRHAVPGTAAVVAELAQAGLTVSALTNWAADMFALARPRFGVLNRFADIVISGELGMVKPNPAIFALACERLGIAPGQAVFVDDSPANIAGAEQAGLTGLLFTGADRLREDLARLGLLGPRPPITEPVFHWALRTDWEQAVATGSYPWSTRGIDANAAGFVHCCFAAQVRTIREQRFADLTADEVVLLRLDPDPRLPIVVENGFPHLFVPLPVAAAQESAPE